MTRYLSNFNCSVCKEKEVFDDEQKTLMCKCGKYFCSFVNPKQFTKIPEDKGAT
jgi:hypothetical protein